MKKLLLMFGIIILSMVFVSCESVTTIVQDFEHIDIEVEETYDLFYIVRKNAGMTVSSNDETIASVQNTVITGVAEGETEIVLKVEKSKQIVSIKVHSKKALETTFSFDKERLYNKKIVAFGDSVTANATIGGQSTYFDIFANSFGMDKGTNYAIGGTTATYMYEGSNIYKEYANNTIAIDGVRVVKKAYDDDKLSDVDYAIIAFGHNDQYFQPPITVEGDTAYDVNSFDSCHSFKGSYRYMINTLRLANPNIRIIILGCTYSEYDKANPSRYGSTYNYLDYRNAMKEIAEEFSLTYIDPWDHLELYFDAYDTKYHYIDSVHLTAQGHLVLGEYICSLR